MTDLDSIPDSCVAEGGAWKINFRAGGAADEVVATMASGQDSVAVGLASARKQREVRVEETLHGSFGAQERGGENPGPRHRSSGEDKIWRYHGGARNQEVLAGESGARRWPGARHRFRHLGHRIPEQRPPMASGTNMDTNLHSIMFHLR